MKKWPWFLLSLTVILIDQGSKYWAMHTLSFYQPFPVIPMLNLTLAYNTGAAFSFLSSTGDWHRWFFAGFSALMSIILTIWITRISPKAFLQLISLSLILGGALGNLIDRVMLGHVIDFIDVYYQNYHWPIFNLADSAICLGAALLLIDLFKNR
ncbi:signal peptidase II [Legionella oakridgensis]|uniref:Lipoprotein signal peptidase n=2 Tax=Legionella oakridgensis TaxID=29423 RepID=W0BE83_9GAMM|nr:signal peptidase II [Legionella oakridgensis]AHE66724.1 lipoprotein signal peptidase [Legionella oakridgensis ATCC 33761 = DSM 21215]KTD38096.1 lipoprotein signal peptidase [Legionella oakridgensis]STY19856.1 signal peptidase II [Legionella longbeachae]